MPEDAVLVEGNAAVAFEIRLDPRSRGNPVAQADEARNLALERLHALRKSIAQPLDDLEQREIDIGDATAGNKRPAACLQYLLEIAEIFRHALLPELLGALLGGRALILVVQGRPERMVGVVDLQHEIGDGQLQLVHPELWAFRLRRQPTATAEIKQDVGSLPDH